MTTTRRRLGCLAVLLASFLMPWRAEAQLTCGGTIGPGGTFTMTSDLTSCPGTGLTVIGPVTLDMNERSISCSGLSTGLRLEGKGASVRNGKVANCTIGIDVEGEGGHKVREMRADATAVGFGISTDGNLLEHDVAHTSGGGFQVNGNRNKLVGNLSVDTSTNAFQISGNGNVFVQNAVHQVQGSGFRSEAGTIGNTFKENQVMSAGVGFDIFGTKHVLKNNTANRSIIEGFRFRAGGGGHVVTDNVCIGIRGEAGYGYGFGVESENTVLKNNRAHELEFGFGLFAPGNVVSGNLATGNAIDALDHDPTCAGNTWKKNVFLLVVQDCVR